VAVTGRGQECRMLTPEIGQRRRVSGEIVAAQGGCSAEQVSMESSRGVEGVICSRTP
jgi:hypothetical protein